MIHKRHSVWVYALALLVFAMLTACSGGGGSGKVLVWTGEGASAEQKAAGMPGEVVYINADGTTEKLLDVPGAASAVMACGDGALSPDRRHFAFLLSTPQGGRDGGTLYQITDADKPQEIGAAHALTCAGNGTLNYSPDSKRLAYIDYDEIPANGEYASGRLRILSAQDRQALADFEQVGAFHLADNHATFLQFYTNLNNQVDEIGVMVWENNRATEIATLFADANCRYSSAQVTPVSGNRIVVLAGHRCASGGTHWQLYVMQRDGNGLQLAMSAPQGGGFFPNTRTNHLFTGVSDQQVLFTVADGLSRHSVGLISASMDNLDIAATHTPILRGAQMPRYTSRVFTPVENANPVFSQNRRWWASVVIDGSVPPVLTVVDLNAPSASPIVTSAARGETISSVMFAPDNATLYYVAGGRNGAENKLYKLNVTNGVVNELSTGAYGGGVIALDGGTLALTQWKKGTDPRETLYQTVVLVNASDGSTRSTVFEGISYNDAGGVQSRKFAHVLAYR